MFEKLIDEICKKNLINSTVFRDSSAKFLDPNFDINSFLCELVKTTDFENISSILNTGIVFPKQQTYFNGLTSVGDPRASLGLTLQAGFTNFMPRNIVYTETFKLGARQIKDNIICDQDGNPIKVPVEVSDTATVADKVKNLDVVSILKDNSELYPDYNFLESICLTQPELKVKDLPENITLDSLELFFESKDSDSNVKSLPEVKPYTPEYSELFSYDYNLDLCKTSLNVNSLFVRTSPDEYKTFTYDFTNFGKEQHLNYFISFLRRFFLYRGWSISLIESARIGLFLIKLTKTYGVDKFITTNKTSNNQTFYYYESKERNVFFKYWDDQKTKLAEKLNIKQIISDISQNFQVSSNSMSRAIFDQIADYRRIMQNSSLQVKFYKYARKYYTEIPEYEPTANSKVTNPKLVSYINNLRKL
jgi:hypothetical protein